ncbi:18S rRNA maturation protein [Onygenales sp. PD_40]|nr:18S rRNA maturation protein [Onygenales sp. PD_40]
MTSFRAQEKRKNMGDSRSSESSKRRRGSYQDDREASPVAQNDNDDRRKYRDRKSPEESRKKPSNPPLEPKPYSIEKSQRDDRAYAAGRAAAKQHQPHEPELPSASVLKSKIRDIKRLLARGDHLPADAKIEKERALIGYERDLEIVQSRKDRAAMIKKYHFVRFLERKSATRQLNKLLRQKKTLTESDSPNKDELKSLEEQIYTTEVDLNYAIYCPLTEKYISLYPTQGRDQPPEPEDSKLIRNTSGEKPPLWYTVEQSMKDGTLELLRDGKLGIGLSGQKNKPDTESQNTLPVLGRSKDRSMETGSKLGKKKEKEKQQGKKQEHSKAPDTQMDMGGDDSDGGFFEE